MAIVAFEISDGMLFCQYTVHPGINPNQDGNGYCGKEAHPEQSSGGRTVENSCKQCYDIHENQQDNADDGNDLFRGNFFTGNLILFFGIFLLSLT